MRAGVTVRSVTRARQCLPYMMPEVREEQNWSSLTVCSTTMPEIAALQVWGCASRIPAAAFLSGRIALATGRIGNQFWHCWIDPNPLIGHD